MAKDSMTQEDASKLFGSQLVNAVIPELRKKKSLIIEEATIAMNGDLTPYFEYLRDYVEETVEP